MNKRQIGYALAFWPKSSTPPTPQTLDYIPAGAGRSRGVRFRVVLAFALLAVAAYLAGQHVGTNPSDYARVAAGNWIIVAMLCGAISGGTAFLGFLFTGRAW